MTRGKLMESDERTYHGDLNRLVVANEIISKVTRWVLGYPNRSNLERLNQIISLSGSEKEELRIAVELLTEVIDKSES
jgi:hypothetical protein